MSDDGTQYSSKVARVIKAYDLDGWGDDLERRWTGEGDQQTSLRDLADSLNEAILNAALNDAGVSITRPEVSTTYRLLQGDDVSQADRRRKERDLEQAGIDPDEIRSDFVTHQAVHNYLTSYRNVEFPGKTTDSMEREIETLRRLQGRITAVAESALNRLIKQHELTEREYRLFVSLRVVCENCGSSYEWNTLLGEGGCDCDV